MSQLLDIPRVIPGDWKRLDLIVNKIKFKLGHGASPTLTGLTITGLTASALVGTDASKALESITIGTGLAYARPTLSLSHLGIEALTDPGADKILFWDNTASASKWLGMGDSIAITDVTIDTIQDIQVTASPMFAGLTVNGVILGDILVAQGIDEDKKAGNLVAGTNGTFLGFEDSGYFGISPMSEADILAGTGSYGSNAVVIIRASGNTELVSAEPYLILRNSVSGDSDGERESRLIFKGKQSGDEETTLVMIEVGHDGTGDDQLGKIVLSVNTGAGLTQALEIDSNLLATFAGNIVIPDTGYIGSASDPNAIQIAASGEVTFTDVATGILPTTGAHLATKEYVDLAIGASDDYFLSDNDDPVIANYHILSETDTGEATSTEVTAAMGINPNQLMFSFITSAGVPGVTFLRSGIYILHTHLEMTTGNRTVVSYWTLSKYTIGDVETVLMTSEISSAIPDSMATFITHAILHSDAAINDTDRLVLKLYANVTGGGANSVITIHMEGTHDCHLTNLLPSNIWQNQGDVLDDLNTLGEVGANSEFLVGTGVGALAWESGATVRTSIGLGTGDSPLFTAVSIGNVDTTITRVSGGVIAVEGTTVMMVGDAPTSHAHDDRYYTETEIGDNYQPLSAVLTNLADLFISGQSHLEFQSANNYIYGYTISQLHLISTGEIHLIAGGAYSLKVIHDLGCLFNAGIYITEQASASGSTATYGQLWTKSGTPNTLWFTDDTGDDFQLGLAGDAGLVDIAGLAVTDGNFIVGDGTNWVAESGAVARTSIGLGTGDSPTFAATELMSTEPYLTLHNSTEEDLADGRESRIIFKGHQSGGEETTLAMIEVGHYGTEDDRKGYLDISINDGDDDDNSLTHVVSINSVGTPGTVRFGIGTSDSNAPLEVVGLYPQNVGNFPSGLLQVRTGDTNVHSNAVITGHNSYTTPPGGPGSPTKDVGNTQLWYLGSRSNQNNDIVFNNRQDGSLSFCTNNIERVTISNNGIVTFAENLVIGDGKTIGQADGPLLTFNDTLDKLGITGCLVGIGTLLPYDALDISAVAGGRFSVSDDQGANRMIILFQSPTESRLFGMVHAYDYGESEGMPLVLSRYGGGVVIGGTSVKTELTVEGTITLKEQASADGDTAAYGQIWVKNTDPNTLWFTDGEGNDHQLAYVV